MYVGEVLDSALPELAETFLSSFAFSPTGEDFPLSLLCH
jgi:hypothetical protein